MVLRKVKKVKEIIPTEHDSQVSVFQEAALRPELKKMFAIPNGGKRHPVVAMKLKAEGVKAGVPDINLPVARGGYHGLFVEMKRKGEKPKDSQLQWHEWLREEGYRVEVCYSAEAAMKVLIEYCLGKLRRYEQ